MKPTAAVKAARTGKARYFVDADHIGLKTVDRFIAPSDFFTLDVADFIGKPAADSGHQGVRRELLANTPAR